MNMIAEILTRASVLVAGGWAQGVLAVTADDRECDTKSPEAASFCVIGAIDRAAIDLKIANGLDFFAAWRVLHNAIPADFQKKNARSHGAALVAWNNAHERTAEEVCATLNAAAAALRG